LIPEEIMRAIAEAERATTQAAAGCLDAMRELAIVRGELHDLQRRLTAAESVGADDIHSPQAELAHAFLTITQTARLLMGAAGKLMAVVEEPPIR
jgi:hypothetical protein